MGQSFTSGHYSVTMHTAAIQVEIVGHWWDALLPIVAIVLSLGTLGWTIWDRNRGAAKLSATDSLTQYWGERPDGSPGDAAFVEVVVRNKGRTDFTTIYSVSLEIPWDKRRDAPRNIVEPKSLVLPKRIEPGEALICLFDAAWIEKWLRRNDGKLVKARLTKSKVRIEGGHGNLAYKLSRQTRQALATGPSEGRYGYN